MTIKHASILAVIGTIALCRAGPLQAAGVTTIKVPELSQWCVNSLPLDGTKLTDSGYRDGAIGALFDLILVPAKHAELKSTGIPYVAAIAPSPPLNGSSTSTSAVVITACAVVKGTDAPAGRRVYHRTLAMAQGYAMLCGAADTQACRDKIIDKIIADLPATVRSSADDWEWRTTQALSTEDSPENLVASVSDFSLRPLGDTPATAAPADTVVILAFPPGTEPKITVGP